MAEKKSRQRTLAKVLRSEIHYISKGLYKSRYPFAGSDGLIGFKKHCCLSYKRQKSFDKVVSEWDDPEAERWCIMFNSHDHQLEFKENLIINSITTWCELLEAVDFHMDFIANDYRDEISEWTCEEGFYLSQINKSIKELVGLIRYIERRICIDALRYSLLVEFKFVGDSYECERFGQIDTYVSNLGALDGKLFQEFERIVQSIPIPGGATPYGYTRGEHFAHDISIRSCEKLLSTRLFPEYPKMVIASSFMGVLNVLLFSFCENRTTIDPFKLYVYGQEGTYFEVKGLLKTKGEKQTSTDKLFGGRLDRLKELSKELDAIYVEPFSNALGGPINWQQVITAAIEYNCKCLIVDATLRPIALFKNEYNIESFKGIIIELHSIAKFVQMGTNIAMGGLAIIHSNHQQKQFTSKLVSRMRSLVNQFGSHSDLNLAKTICTNPEVLRNRINRSCKNAEILRRILNSNSPSNGGWIVHTSDSILKPTVWVIINKKKWKERAIELLPKWGPSGSRWTNIDPKKMKLREMIVCTLECHLWFSPIDNDDEKPTLRSSFGFNQTNFLFKVPEKNQNEVRIRISCGVETVEMLSKTAYQLLDLLGK